MRRIDEIIVHCTANRPFSGVTPEDIRKDHVKNRGFVDCGYHYIIDEAGVVYPMRPLSLIGAHCRKHNNYSIGIAYIGGYDENFVACDTRTPAQKKALLNLILVLKSVFPNIQVFGHRDFANKACPCFDASTEYKDIDKTFHLVSDLECDEFDT